MTSAPSPRTPLNAVLQETDEAQDSVVAVEELHVHCPVTAHDADSRLLTSPRMVSGQFLHQSAIWEKRAGWHRQVTKNG